MGKQLEKHGLLLQELFVQSKLHYLKVSQLSLFSFVFPRFSFLRLSIQKVSFVTIFLFASTLRNSNFSNSPLVPLLLYAHSWRESTQPICSLIMLYIYPPRNGELFANASLLFHNEIRSNKEVQCPYRVYTGGIIMNMDLLGFWSLAAVVASFELLFKFNV